MSEHLGFLDEGKDNSDTNLEGIPIQLSADHNYRPKTDEAIAQHYTGSGTGNDPWVPPVKGSPATSDSTITNFLDRARLSLEIQESDRVHVVAGMLSTLDILPAVSHPAECLPMARHIHDYLMTEFQNAGA